jgi:hypothetical protein
VKRRVYLRFAIDRHARAGFRVDASPKAQPRPLVDARDNPLHTVRFAVDLDVPDSLLRPERWPVVNLQIGEGHVEQIAMTITQPEEA